MGECEGSKLKKGLDEEGERRIEGEREEERGRERLSSIEWEKGHK